MVPFLVVAATGAAVTALVTPLVARFARRIGAVDRPHDPRKVHRDPVPTLGGIAMFVGLLAAVGVAFLLPEFRPLFTTTSEPLALVVGGLAIVAIGVADDLFGLPPTVSSPVSCWPRWP